MIWPWAWAVLSIQFALGAVFGGLWVWWFMRVVRRRLIGSVKECVEALRLTREYVGEERLPALEGWSWYDATLNAEELLEDLHE